MPETVGVGENIVANFSFQTNGYQNVNDVVLMAKNGNKTIKSTSIGTISPGVTKSQGITFSFDEVGKYDVDFVISYTDADGENKIMDFGKYSIVVGSSASDSTVGGVIGQGNTNNRSGKDFLLVFVSSIILIALMGVMVMYVKRNRR